MIYLLSVSHCILNFLNKINHKVSSKDFTSVQNLHRKSRDVESVFNIFIVF